MLKATSSPKFNKLVAMFFATPPKEIDMFPILDSFSIISFLINQ